MTEIKPPIVDKPNHYTDQVPGIECIQVVQHFNFNRGNIIKYAWRCGDKGDPIEDLQKVMKYAEFEIARIRRIHLKATGEARYKAQEETATRARARGGCIGGTPPFVKGTVKGEGKITVEQL